MAVLEVRPAALLGLLQITDSFFPTGGFAHSNGLESYIQAGVVIDAKGLTGFLTAHLLGITARCDAVATRLAYQAARRDDIEVVVRLDRILGAQKLAREGREASLKMGRQMLQTAAVVFDAKFLRDFNERILNERDLGHHAPVFGLIGHVFGVSENELCQAYVYTVAASVVANAVRAIPLGQKAGQTVLAGLHPVMLKTVANSEGLTCEDLGTSAPALEIACMAHERLGSRVFMS